VVLLGDSVFDNGAYVGGGPDVAQQLREASPPDWTFTLLAVDGATTRDVPRQLGRVPGDATHLVLSVGGNDALGEVGVLDRPARSVADALDVLADVAGGFRERYADILRRTSRLHLPVIACTIYEGALPDPVFRRRALTALVHFNDVIVRTAVQEDADLIDLRLVCVEAGDYANPIEPSLRGGRRIAAEIARAVAAPRDHGARGRMFAPDSAGP
jgi:hypothetical protein